MIQRIQTIFLALAAGAGFSTLGFPFAQVEEKIESSALFSNDLHYDFQDNIVLLIAFAVSGVLALVAIFLYKNRKKQILVTRIAAFAVFVSAGLAAFFLWQDVSVTAAADVLKVGVSAFTPIVSFVLLLLAAFYIGKDEKLVRSSYDRLR